MAKHKLYRQFEDTSLLIPSLSEEVFSVSDVHPSIPDTEAHVRRSIGESKCADKSVTNEKKGNKKEITNKNFSEPSPGGDCASDCDSDDSFYTYSGSGSKLPYSAKEDEWILKYVLEGQNVLKVGSISLWKYMEIRKENPKRTYQSLKNRFLRSIKPYIFTRYGHLITSEKETKKILDKFPELRCKVGRTNTLSRIQLPTRNPNSECVERGLVNGSRDNDERVTSPRTSTSDGPPRTSTSDGPPNGLPPRELILNLNFSNFERKVKIRGKSPVVWVNFNSKQQLHKPISPPIGIYEQYKKCKKKNKLVFCAACGRYNIPRKNKLVDPKADEESLNLSGRRQVLTSNSSGGDPANSSVTTSESPPVKYRKVGESEPRRCIPSSPNLLRDAGEENDLPVGWDAQERPLETGEVDRPPDTPPPVALRQEADSEAGDRLKEADDDLESTYDDTVTDFKKLIKNEEERLLVRKCLYGKGGVLGISDSISQMSMESYFVDLSPNLETPQLTNDYSTQRTGFGEIDNPCSLLARNMMKMLEENKTSEES